MVFMKPSMPAPPLFLFKRLRLIKFLSAIPLLMALLVSAGPIAAQQTEERRGSEAILNQAVDQADGKSVRLGELTAGNSLTVLLFLGADCPLSQKAVTESVIDLAKSGSPAKVGLLGLLVARDDALDIQRLKDEFKAAFPLLLDRNNQLAGILGVTVVPTAVVVDQQGKVLYQGRINDRVEQLGKRSVVRRHDMREAISDAAKGLPVRVPKTPSVGCPVELRKPVPDSKGKAEYHRDIQPILYKHCAVCHQEKGVAPFSLANYQDATLWVEMGIDLIERKIMPPGQAESDFALSDAPSVPSPQELRLLRQWLEEGMPKGAVPANTRALPPTDPESADLGKPDLVLKPDGPMTLAASGDDMYRYMVYKLNLNRELKVRAMRFIPGNQKVVHHTLIWFADSATQARIIADKGLNAYGLLPDDSGPGYGQSAMLGKYHKIDTNKSRLPFEQIGGYAPGHSVWKTPAGCALSIPEKTDLVVQMHYHRSGKVETDFSSIELYLAKGDINPAEDFRTTNINDDKFLLMPPNQRRRTNTAWPVEDDCRIVGISPHGHLLTVSQTVTLERPDGTRKVLLNVPRFDFNWQRMYTFREPIPVAKGSKVHVSSLMDNTSGNPANPFKPPKAIFMGEATTDEMVFPFVALTIPKNSRWNLQQGFFSGYRTGIIATTLKQQFGLDDQPNQASPAAISGDKQP